VDKVNVSRLALIKALEKNRERHKATYEKAKVGFKKKLIEVFSRALVVAKTGKYPTKLHLPIPAAHLEEYDRALGMLKMHTDDTITLTAQEYDCYIRDEWDWKAAWSASNSAYGGGGGGGGSLRKILKKKVRK
jgi:hypothetical protein